MIAALLSILGSSAVGSILGGVFALLNRKSDLEAKRLELEHERGKWAHEAILRDKDISLASAEAQGRKEVAIIEGDATIESARMGAIAAAQQADMISADEIKAAGQLGWVFVLASAFNKLIRPISTVILTGAAVYLNWILIDKLSDGWATMTTAQQYDASMQAFAWITGQAGAVLGYWFVSRGSSK